uniref:hypothetical protein n=1 Tax=Chloroflexus sp. TaxID=1904827 RepID=UPI002ACD9CC5
MPDERTVNIQGIVSGSPIITGDANTVIQYLTAPIRRLPMDYASRIQDFLTLYLGTPERPVPFGGRDDKLRDLDAWLSDPDRPYALLTAPAGRGKSALLVRWLTSLRTRQPDLKTVFVPVSIRFSTNLASVTFASLAAQLARAFDEDVPTDANTPDEVWRGLCRSYLDRKPPSGGLLVVLDGLDEAANWRPDGALFPQHPLPGLKVLVSARLTVDRPRADDWQRALVWQRLNVTRLDLLPLNHLGLRDVLEKMGVPLDELARQPFIVEELYRLTEGDPLLTGLYVADLWAQGEAVRRLKPEDLRSLRPGYEGYIERWWDDQRVLWGVQSPLREAGVRAVLNLLATALGPLRKEDLLVLADPSAGLDSWTLEDSLRPLARFVVLSGDGYVFAHPRLGEYFWNKLTPNEQRKMEERFLSWGRDVLAKLQSSALSPQQAPPYVVRYYRIHMERAGLPLSDLRPLVETYAWAQAWEMLEGALGSYLSDVQAVWKRASEENCCAAERNDHTPYLGLEIRCALIEASVHSLAANLPTALLAALVKHGMWTMPQALVYLRQMPHENHRAEALVALAECITAEVLLAEVLAVAREIKDDWKRAEVLAAVAARAPAAVLAAVLAAARAIEDDWWRAEVLAAVAERVPDLWPEVLAAAREIGDVEKRAEVLATVAERLANRPRAWLYPCWVETLPVLASRVRPDLLSDLRALAPLIHAL